MVFIKADCAAAAHILAAVRQAPAAGVCHFIAAHRALVAGDVDDLDHVGVVGAAAHGQFDALGQDGALLVYAAAHGGLLARHNDLGNIQHVFQQRILPRLPRHLAQHLIFEVLYLGIELTHGIALLPE